MSAPALTFLAPPSTGDEHEDTATDVRPTTSPTRRAGPPSRGRQAGPALRMTRGAREAATGAGIADADVQRCLDAPDDVSPHPDDPTRTWFRRGPLVVLAGADGMVLRVSRRGR
ncbi:hypothetical protein [Geodermatophilus maliterrae]|uniref:Uncharacterized protein n=1 Tax=Geodermatophilus maliterrae TaxID=3162531 RepID=A0ABV3XA17_9ACTN